jgi:hypothetical protein
VQRNHVLEDLGCLAYEVGGNDEEPDTVFVVELWTSAAAHAASLQHADVVAAIADARSLLNGPFGGFRFDAAGSPLRDQGVHHAPKAADPRDRHGRPSGRSRLLGRTRLIAARRGQLLKEHPLD